MHTKINITNSSYEDYAKKFINLRASKNDCLSFQAVFQELNGLYEHWQRLYKIIKTYQMLKSFNYNIFLINGLLDWDKEFFTHEHSQYGKRILNYHCLPDSDISIGLTELASQTAEIDLSMWVNPFESFRRLKVDNAPLDNHPGAKSHKIYSEIVLNKLTTEDRKVLGLRRPVEPKGMQ